MDSTVRGLWGARGLVGTLVSRDVRARTRQAFFGVGWIAIQPLIATGAVTLLVRGVLGLELTETPYPVFVMAGLLPWQIFSTGIAASAGSLVQHRDLITQVPFPRAALPLYPLVSKLIDFGVGVIALIGVLALHQMAPSTGAFLAILLVIPAIVLAYAASLILAPLALAARDLDRILAFVFSFLIYAVPVLYPLERIAPTWQTLYLANPAVGIVVNFRSLFLEGFLISPGALLWSCCVAVFGLALALRAFRAVEQVVADVV